MHGIKKKLKKNSTPKVVPQIVFEFKFKNNFFKMFWELSTVWFNRKFSFRLFGKLILLYGCTTWTLTKWLKKKLDSNYTRMLRAILNKSWRQHPTRHQLYSHLPPITKTIQVRQTRHAAHCWRSRDELISDVLLLTPTYGTITSSNIHSAAIWGYRM